METKERTRTSYAIINILTGGGMQIVNIILGFISRTIFINILNSDYLGINSLFSNILSVLSFAELGIGNAIIFNLYKPIADKNKDKVQVLMKLYQKAYWIIGITIFILGLLIIPFMDFIIKDKPDIRENLILIYILFLANTSISYFYSYKKSLITATQKNYIVEIYTRVFQLVQIIFQTIFLVLTHEYLIYLVILLLCTIGQNVALSAKADKLFPYIKEKNNNILSKDETKSIFNNVKALLIYRFGSVILNGTDNIIISSLFNVGIVGIASNYSMLIKNATDIIGSATNSLTATIGNLSVDGSKEKIKNILYQLLLICSWAYGLIAVGFFCLANDFISLWVGDSYVLSQWTVFALVFSLYINGVQYPAYTFRTTQGMFVQSKWIPLISAVVNIVLSIWWGKLIGLAGIFIATGVSRLLTTTVVDPWLVYKNNFNQLPFEYYFKYSIESLAVIINGFLQFKLTQVIIIDGWLGFCVKFIVVCLSTNIVFLIEFGWTKDFKALIRRILPKLLRRGV